MNEIVEAPLRIGSVPLASRVILAPMAGVCDLPYRRIAKAHGAALVCTEMVSDKGLVYHNGHTQEMLQIAKDEHPLSLQLFGADPASMAYAAAAAEEAGADLVDINMGCPVKKVVRNGAGAALLQDLPRAEAIIRAVVQAVSIPVTVKMRAGWDAAHVVAPALAERAEAAGAAAVAVHGRTREAFYSGKADWRVIADTVQAVSIPVIGNGDVVDGPSARDMLQQTGCAAVMVARAAQGNPWIFSQITHYLTTGETAVAVHGRTREAFYSGKADWRVIADTVQAVSIPVIGNGDVVDGPSARDMLQQTGCAAVMVARAAQGNPWIFSQITHYLTTGETAAPPTAWERYTQILAHLEALVAYKGEYIGIREMRAHASWYTRGLYGSAALRERINRTVSVAEFRAVVEEMRRHAAGD